MKRAQTFVVAAFFMILPFTASAHPGNTDSSGCHTCRTNCPRWGLSSGEYHCHNSKGVQQPLAPIRSHNDGTTELWPEYNYTSTVQATTIGSTLTYDMKNGQVTRLQQILARYPDIYPEGLITGYFGVATERAVKNFQKKYGLEQVGIVGPKTRALLNSL